MTTRGAGGLNAAGLAAVSLALLAFLAPFGFGGGQYAFALTASASALALLTAALLHCARIANLPVGAAEAAHEAAAARTSFRAPVVLPQRDPDAAGKPRPRAPGVHPSTVV